MQQRLYKTVIGMEIHARVLSKTKLFSRAPVAAIDAAPNTTISGFDLSLPGTLPVLNKYCVDQSIKAGLALNGDISPVCLFERKHYFYHDCPSGYQITQSRYPIMKNGQLFVLPPANKSQKRNSFHPFQVNIKQIQLEQDTGKSFYDENGYSLIDLNRAGAPLMEIVTTPCIHGASEASSFLSALQNLLQIIGVSEAKPENGSLRADINVNVVSEDNTIASPIVELKNLNSIHIIEDAIHYEVDRQIDALEHNIPLYKETRSYNPELKETFVLRKKENAYDYRIFPDPDVRPLKITQDRIQSIQSTLPELPASLYLRLQKQYKLSEYESAVLINEIGSVPYFESVCKNIKNPTLAWNWICNELFAYLRTFNIPFANNPVSAENLRQIIINLENNKINGPMAKSILKQVWETKRNTEDIIKENNFNMNTNQEEIQSLCDTLFTTTLKNNKSFLNQHFTGDNRVLPWLVGQILKETKGKCNPNDIKQIFETKLNSLKQQS
ncbi:hypothetical protein WA158_000308 [Blastocystis sp. Blastoise]